MSDRSATTWLEDSQFLFPPFRLDRSDERLWRDSQPIDLRPKTFRLLTCLLDTPGKLLTKDTLLDAVWPGIHVSDAVLRGCIREIRQALDDLAGAPKFIETVPRRGYRFIAEARRIPTPVRQANGHGPPVPSSNGNEPVLTEAAAVVGREGELERLRRAFESALAGARQITLVVGEPGIGKTTLVESFINSTLVEKNATVGYGQCIERYGPGEAYMPVLQALLRLCRDAGGEQVVGVLHKYAPDWVLQMPSLLGDREMEKLQRRNGGVSHERMQRELAEAIEVLAERKPLLLVLEDLHWADPSTLELISMLASRREAARLMLIGTYRPSDVQAKAHPLRNIEKELLRHHSAERLHVSLLTDAAVSDYLMLRFPQGNLPQGLAALVRERTEGNPLFMVEMANHLIAEGTIAQSETGWKLQSKLANVDLGIPRDLRQLIEKELETLSAADQEMLQAASIVGVEITAPCIAAALQCGLEEVERRANTLARSSHLFQHLSDVEWPDGALAARYGFTHQLYREVLYDGVGAARRMRLHQRVGECKEAAFAGKLGEVAGKLAMHFEASRDFDRAVRYLELAAQNALNRHSHREAAEHLTRAIRLAGALAPSVDRTRRECSLQTTLGQVLRTVKGYTAPEVGIAFLRAGELSASIKDRVQLGRALHGLWEFDYKRGVITGARKHAERLLKVSQSDSDSAIEAYYAMAATQTCAGEFSSAYSYASKAIALHHPELHGSHSALYGQDPGMFSQLWASIAAWFLGYSERALTHSLAMLTLAQGRNDPTSLIPAYYTAAVLRQMRREPAIAQQHIAAAAALAEEHQFPYFLSRIGVMTAWLKVVAGQEAEGIQQMGEAIGALDSMGALWFRPYNLALLAEAQARAGRPKAGLESIKEASAASNIGGQHFYDAELYRLQGELTLQIRTGAQRRSGQSEAEEYFIEAIEEARRRAAKSLQLRATVSLSRLWQAIGKEKQARAKLAESYRSLSEGFDTHDMMEAKKLLAELA
ncbi:MAG TPA: AAA family ATPase [Candidatus Binataceae bacterium]|nr:AAA family ATPase [Candidatus Binataceae bacterium]